jgi:hypothetical protein
MPYRYIFANNAITMYDEPDAVPHFKTSANLGRVRYINAKGPAKHQLIKNPYRQPDNPQEDVAGGEPMRQAKEKSEYEAFAVAPVGLPVFLY